MIRNTINTTERKVLSHFFIYPNEEEHIRGLTRKLKTPYSATRNALHALAKKDVLKKRTESKMTFFKANKTKKFTRLKRLFNIQSLYDTGLADELESKLRPDALVLFGSFLEGTDHENSDIDIAAINGRDTTINLTAFKNKLKRDIHVINVDDLKKEKKTFRNTVANGFVLCGYVEVI